MIPIEKNYSLKRLNTFGIEVDAAYYSVVNQKSQLAEMSAHREFQNGVFILGGGSNLLLTKNITNWVWHNQIEGIKIIRENDDFVWIEVGAGEVWNDFVQFAVGKGFGGVENLSLIPGSVGAAPVQNIGAYGVEVRQTIDRVNVWHLFEKCEHTFSNEDCRFGYRDSVFKNKFKGQVIITTVVFKLRKKPIFSVEYGTVRKELEKAGVGILSVKAISDVIMKIRKLKLPDPVVIGNAGSFFKNPAISIALFHKLQEQFSEIPGYPTILENIKIPAAWLIEKSGWKGFREGAVGVHSQQALVLVNYGNAEGKEVFELSERIILSVKEKFGIQLEREVQVY